MKGYGTKFHRSADSGSSYVQVANLLDITPNEVSKGTYETTGIDDTTGYKTYEGGIRDAGEVSLTLLWDVADTGQVNLKADLDADINGYYQIEYPDGTTVEFIAVLTGWGLAAPIEDKVTRTVKFKLSGEPTITAP